MKYDSIPYVAFSDFIDTKNEKININEKYTGLLSVLKPYIYAQDDENADHEKNELDSDYDMRFREDACAIEVIDVYSIDMLCELKDAVINEDIVFKGLPADNSNGSYVSPGLKIAMLTTCKEKEKAWDFIRRYIDDEYQKQIYGSCFPVKKDAFELLYSKCEETSYHVGDTEYDVHVPDQEFRKMITEWISSVTSSVCTEKRISDIINEELGAYFAGQQNEEETLKELKRKIELYLSEV